ARWNRRQDLQRVTAEEERMPPLGTQIVEDIARERHDIFRRCHLTTLLSDARVPERTQSTSQPLFRKVGRSPDFQEGFTRGAMRTMSSACESSLAKISVLGTSVRSG